MGITLMVAAGMARVQGVVYRPCRLARANGRVIRAWEVATTSGQRKLFQLAMKAKMPKVASAGLESGITIREKTVQWLAPSMKAASSSSWGRLRKAWRRRNVPNADATVGRIRPGEVLTNPRTRIPTHSGTLGTW